MTFSFIMLIHRELKRSFFAFPGDSNTIPTKFNNVERERESSGRKVSVQCISRTHDKSYENEGN